MPVRILQLMAILLTALALVPGGAHLLEIAHKIDLDRESYVAVQQIYRGWALLGSILVAAIVVNGLGAVAMRSQTMPMLWSALAAVLLCGTVSVFFGWTFPVNQATSDWTVAPDNWQMLRAQWEYSHVANSIVTFLALCSATAASLSWSR
jgi:hypothetical protein